MTYDDAIKMTPEELRDHPEVEMCACAHMRGLHKSARCVGGYAPPMHPECGCTAFEATGLRLKNSLITIAKESRADIKVNPALTQHRDLFFDGSSLDPEYMRVGHLRSILSKIRSIIADGERELNPDADPEYDTNNLYDLVREGVEAKKIPAEGERPRAAPVTRDLSPTDRRFQDADVNPASAYELGRADERERCARVVADFEDFVYREVSYAGSVVDERPSMERLAELIRSGK